MKFFSSMLAIAGVVLMGVVGAFADEDLDLSAIITVIDVSGNLEKTCEALTAANFAQEGNELVSGINDITIAISQSSTEITVTSSGQAPFDDHTAVIVVGALDAFVTVHQNLLECIIRQHSLAAQFLFAAPIASGLPGLESVVDAFMDLLISLIPTRASQAGMAYSSLNVTFTEAITAYQS